MRKFVCIALAMCMIRLANGQQDSTLHLYLLVGQSNMAGRGEITASYRELQYNNIFMLNKSGEWVPAHHPLHFDKPIAGVGPGLAFAKAISDEAGEQRSINSGSRAAGLEDGNVADVGATDAGSTDAGSTDAGSTDAGSTDASSKAAVSKTSTSRTSNSKSSTSNATDPEPAGVNQPVFRIGLVPCAVGGTSISSWVPGGYDNATKTHPLDDALARIKIALTAGKFDGIIWHQGESDSDPKAASTYISNLKVLIARLRQAAGDPQLPFVAAELGQFKQVYALINDQLKNLSAVVPYTGLARSSGLTDKGDTTHFDSRSADELGRRMAAEMIRLQKLRSSGLNKTENNY